MSQDTFIITKEIIELQAILFIMEIRLKTYNLFSIGYDASGRPHLLVKNIKSPLVINDEKHYNQEEVYVRCLNMNSLEVNLNELDKVSQGDLNDFLLDDINNFDLLENILKASSEVMQGEPANDDYVVMRPAVKEVGVVFRYKKNYKTEHYN